MASSIVNNFDIGSNFWKVNSQLVYAGEIGKFYDGDKSKGKEESSRVMWSIALCCDVGSMFKNLPLKEREEMVRGSYNKGFELSRYMGLYDEYERMTKTSWERQIGIWEDKLDEKTDYIKSLDYRKDSDKIEKLLLTNGKLWEEYNKIREEIEKDRQKGAGDVRGKSRKSAAESNLI